MPRLRETRFFIPRLSFRLGRLRFRLGGVVKRRCARMLPKSHSRLRETKNRMKQIDTSRAKRPCEMRSKSGALAYAKRVSESLAYAKRRF